jgi:hypothetical protein
VVCVQEAARGRDVRVIRTVAIMKAKDAHLVDEFCGWDAALEGYPSQLTANVRYTPALPARRCIGSSCAACTARCMCGGLVHTPAWGHSALHPAGCLHLVQDRAEDPQEQTNQITS